MSSITAPDIVRSVLIVGDNPSMRRILTAWLESAAPLPYMVLVASADSEFEMFELLALRRFHAILVCSDSGTDGASIVRSVKSDPRHASIPCLLGSVRELVHLVREGESCGADYLISYADHTADDLELFLWDSFEAPQPDVPEVEYPSPASTLRPHWSPVWNRLPL